MLRSLFRACIVAVLDSWRVVTEFRISFCPVENNNAFLTVGDQLMRVVWVKLNPKVFVLWFACFYNFANNRSSLSFISPVPQTNCLRCVHSKCNNVLIVN